MKHLYTDQFFITNDYAEPEVFSAVITKNPPGTPEMKAEHPYLQVCMGSVGPVGNMHWSFDLDTKEGVAAAIEHIKKYKLAIDKLLKELKTFT